MDKELEQILADLKEIRQMNEATLAILKEVTDDLSHRI